MPFKTALENMPQPSLLDASALNSYYSSVWIQSLSPSERRRLKKGHHVRVKLGTAHNIHLSPEQIKNLHAAAKKGKAITVVFDPIQIQNHGRLLAAVYLVMFLENVEVKDAKEKA